MLKVNYDKSTVLRICSVLNDNEHLFIDEELLFEISEAVRILTDAYQNKNNSIKDNDYFSIMAETFMVDFHNKSPEALIFFVRQATMNGICITYTDVPFFRIIVSLYSSLLREARCITFNEYQQFKVEILGM